MYPPPIHLAWGHTVRRSNAPQHNYFFPCTLHLSYICSIYLAWGHTVRRSHAPQHNYFYPCTLHLYTLHEVTQSEDPMHRSIIIFFRVPSTYPIYVVYTLHEVTQSEDPMHRSIIIIIRVPSTYTLHEVTKYWWWHCSCAGKYLISLISSSQSSAKDGKKYTGAFMWS